MECTLKTGSRCGQPAAALLLVSMPGTDAWHAYPRCPEHNAHSYVRLITRAIPGAHVLVLPLLNMEAMAAEAEQLTTGATGPAA